MKNHKNGEPFKLLREGFTAKDNKGNEVFYPPVYVTMAYELLELLAGINRPVMPSHSAALGKSVLLFGNLRDVVIVKIGHNYYIADGQNLELFLKNSDLPVVFKLVVAHDVQSALKLIAVMNSTAKGWGIPQYINAWANFSDSYSILREMRKEHQMTYTTIAMLLSQSPKSLVRERIKNGTFTTLNVEKAKKVIATIENFYNAMADTGLVPYSYTTEGLIEFMNNIGFDEYLANEKKTIRNAIALNKVAKIRTFARVEDVVEFMYEVYEGKRTRLLTA